MSEIVPLGAPTLETAQVRLKLLSTDDASALLETASENPALYAWTPVPRTMAAMQGYVDTAIEGWKQGHMLPFAIIRCSDGKVVGSTRFYSVERWAWPDGHPQHGRTTPDVCEVGYTWLGQSAVRTAVNTHAKRLMLRYAFETWRVHRLSLRTDVRNVRSREAIQRLGAKLDGCIRCDKPGSDGTVRDSAVYSVVSDEWPEVSARLQRLEERR